MQPEPTKATFDPIPVSSPAPRPASKPSEPAAAKPTAPAKPAPAAAVPAWLKGVFAPSKNKGIVAAAGASLLVGWYGLKTVFPPMPRPTETARSQPDTPALPGATPELTPTPPVAAAPTGFLPPIAVPAVDLTPPSAVAPAAAPPVVVPLVNLDPTTPAAAKPVPFTVPSATGSEIKPASFDDIKVPAVPPATGGSPMPSVVLPDATAGGPPAPIVVPVIPGVSPPAVAEKPKEKPAEVPPPAIPAVDLSGLGSSPAPAAPAPVAVPPAAAPTVAGPPAATPTLTVPSVPAPAVPSAPGGASLAAPELTFSKPAAPVATTPPAPIASVTPASPVVTPTPTLLPVSGGSPAATAPAAPAVETKTDFDVDLHYPKPGDTYASISKLHYGDERYARVLEQFNVNAGSSGRVIQVPPTWWVKKQTGAPVSRPAPAPAKGDEWSAAPASATRVYEVPATKTGGMTFRDIATQLYGTDQEWQRVFDLNPQYAADAVLPAGTKVRVANR